MVYLFGILSNILAFIFFVHAYWRGGSVERYGAAIMTASWISSTVFQSHDGNGPGLTVFFLDTLTMIALLIFAERTRTLWGACSAAFLVLSVLTHIAYYTTRQMSLVAYITAAGIFGGYGMILPLGCRMIALEWQRATRKRTG